MTASKISQRIHLAVSLIGSAHEREINGTRYRFTRFDDGALRVVTAARWDPASGTWIPAHLWYARTSPLAGAALPAMRDHH